MARAAECLVLGLGNVLCGDDGLGVFVTHLLLRCYRAPRGVRILDGGTLGLSLLPSVQDAASVVLLDAIASSDAPPGTFVRLDGAQVHSTVRERLSPHQIGVADLLDAAVLLGQSPSRMILLGMVAESVELGLGLSPALQSQVEEFVNRVAVELAELGYPLEPLAAPGGAHAPMERDLLEIMLQWSAGSPAGG